MSTSTPSRAQGEFVDVNCAAIPDNLLEIELFGHERGAFTGAAAAKPGLIEAANGGTMFLDEIGEMDPALQAKLLHVLEHQRVRAGSARTRPIDVDVRFVAATNRDLARRGQGRHVPRGPLLPPAGRRHQHAAAARARRRRSSLLTDDFLAVLGSRYDRGHAVSSPTCASSSGATTGPGTCANSETCWSVSSFWRMEDRSCPATCRPASCATDGSARRNLTRRHLPPRGIRTSRAIHEATAAFQRRLIAAGAGAPPMATQDCGRARWA